MKPEQRYRNNSKLNSRQQVSVVHRVFWIAISHIMRALNAAPKSVHWQKMGTGSRELTEFISAYMSCHPN